jgi:hypothetical protein
MAKYLYLSIFLVAVFPPLPFGPQDVNPQAGPCNPAVQKCW